MKYQFKIWIIKTIICLGLILMITSCCDIDPCSSDDCGGDYEASEPFQYSIDFEQKDRVRIEGVSGPITISGTSDERSVEIWGRRLVRSYSLKDAESQLASLEVRVSSNDETVFVQTLQPKDSDGRNYIVEYYLNIPEDWLIEVSHINGDLRVDSLVNASVLADIANGSIELVDMLADCNAHLTNGNIHLSNVEGNLEIGLTNGNIGGYIVVPHQGGDRISTVNGEIDLSIPKETSARLSAKITNGSINVSNLILKDLMTSRTQTSGTLSNGDGQISISVVNGEINVRGYE